MTKAESTTLLYDVYRTMELEFNVEIIKGIKKKNVVECLDYRTKPNNYLITLHDYTKGRAIGHVVILQTPEHYYNAYLKKQVKRYIPNKIQSFSEDRLEAALGFLYQHSLRFW